VVPEKLDERVFLFGIEAGADESRLRWIIVGEADLLVVVGSGRRAAGGVPWNVEVHGLYLKRNQLGLGQLVLDILGLGGSE
jgi:hypothetical protein